MVWAIFFVVISAGMVFSHSTYMMANRKEMATRNKSTLATNFARSGLTDALSWFQRQPTQPVVAFAPQLDETADPPLADTLDPELGLVREFEVRGNLWGRYEVRHAEVDDISGQRSMTTAGTVWELGARGVLYRRVDPDQPFNRPPNRVEAVTNLRTEMRTIPVRAPAQAAVSIGGPGDVTVLGNASVVGGEQPAFAFDQTSLDLATEEELGALPAETLDGVPPTVGVFNYDDSATKVFSMRFDQLQSCSDFVVASADVLPRSVDRYRLVFAESDLTLEAGRGQRGDIVLIVNGDLTAEPGNDTDISGLVYVVGDAKIQGEFRLRGTMIVGGQLEIGGAAQAVVLEYDGGAVDLLTQALSRYRNGRAVQAIPNATSSPESDTGDQGDHHHHHKKKKWDWGDYPSWWWKQ